MSAPCASYLRKHLRRPPNGLSRVERLLRRGGTPTDKDWMDLLLVSSIIEATDLCANQVILSAQNRRKPSFSSQFWLLRRDRETRETRETQREKERGRDRIRESWLNAASDAAAETIISPLLSRNGNAAAFPPDEIWAREREGGRQSLFAYS